MDRKTYNAFVIFQQGELDAVYMYRKLAEIAKTPVEKEAFLEAAKDEGKHAAILSKYTGKDLKPDETLGNTVQKLYKFMPRRISLFGVAQGEYMGGKGYRPYTADYPELEKIMFDEYRHGDKMKSLSKK